MVLSRSPVSLPATGGIAPTAIIFGCRYLDLTVMEIITMIPPPIVLSSESRFLARHPGQRSCNNNFRSPVSLSREGHETTASSFVGLPFPRPTWGEEVLQR
jgi:hypothetical protein